MEGQSREKDILDILYERDRISVAELAKILFVSEMTVRRDLTSLEKKGVDKRHSLRSANANNGYASAAVRG
jgi:DeoR/GlpR family transcriptional regulator of sugar metabolism